MNRLLRIATLALVVLAFATKSYADPITAIGQIHSTLSIVSVVDSSSNPVSKIDLLIQSDPSTITFDDLNFGGGFSTVSADADGGVDPRSLGIGDTIAITSSISFGLNGPGSSQPVAISTLEMLISNATVDAVTVNFALDYQLDLDLSSWADSETFASAFGGLEIAHGDVGTVLLLEHELRDPVGGSYAVNDGTTFAITLAAGQDTTLAMTSILGGDASSVPEPATSVFVAVLCLIFQIRSRRRAPQ